MDLLLSGKETDDKQNRTKTSYISEYLLYHIYYFKSERSRIETYAGSVQSQQILGQAPQKQLAHGLFAATVQFVVSTS